MLKTFARFLPLLSIAVLPSLHIRRRLALAILCLSLPWTAIPAAAHVGGHGLDVGTVLHVWTEPATGRPMPGSLSFVREGHVYLEDPAGRRHAWPIESLAPADRVVVDAFLAKVERLSARPARAPAGEPSPGTAPGIWVWIGVGAVAGLVALRRRPVAAPARAIGVASLVGLALACGGGTSGAPAAGTPTTPSPVVNVTPTLAPFFTAFPQHVRTREDASYLYVESDGLADHVMMTGIRSWQQQVPLPADYSGGNAWRIPLAPRLAAQPVSARTGLFRGAIALAVNGVPIFNALNNRGDDAFLAGELDDFGGHAGRADDYHYHTAPLFLSATVGATRPIAVALDGYLLYGAVEPDGSVMRALDEYNGHTDTALGYHYHGTRTYPYINGGMKGEVQVSDQVEPQPSVRPVRPALTPLQGATITRHASTGPSSWTLEYQIAGRTSRVDYRIEGARVTFVFTDPSGASRTEVYTR